MITRQRVYSVLGAVILSVLLISRVEAADKVKFLLDWVWWPPHIPLIVAQEKGFFSEAGLDVEMTQGQGSGSTSQLIGQGVYDIGNIELPVAAQAITQGAKMKVVANTTAKGATGIVFKKGALKSVQDLKGRKIGAAAQGSGTLLFPAFLAANHLTNNDVSLVIVPPDGQIPALLTDRVSVVIGPGYYYVPIGAAQGYELDSFNMADYGVAMIGYGLVANESMIKERSKVIRRFIAAVAKGFEYSQNNVDESVAIYNRFVGGQKQDPETVRRIFVGFMKLRENEETKGKSFGWNGRKNWESTLDLLVKFVGMAKPMPIDAYYTNEFLAH